MDENGNGNGLRLINYAISKNIATKKEYQEDDLVDTLWRDGKPNRPCVH